VLERFADALSCIDECFIADQTLERLPMASRVGKVVVGRIDINKPRMRAVAEAIIALSAASNGFTASELAARVCELGKQTPAHYGPTRAAYDLKKFRGQQIVQRIGQTRRYAVCPAGLKTITALISSFSEKKPSDRFLLPPRNADQAAARGTRPHSMPTTMMSERPCEECSMNSA
jgi:hypothetical protein